MKMPRMMISGLLALFLLFNLVSAQETASQEMTKEAWKQAMDEATIKRDQLRKEVENLDKEIARLKERDAQLAAEIQKEEAELSALLAEAAQFEERLVNIENSLGLLEKLSRKQLAKKQKDMDDVQSSITDAKANTLAQLPAYGSRLDSLQQRLDRLHPSGAQRRAATSGQRQATEEIVVGTWEHDGACLWNIAGMQTVYNDPTLWVKLWQGNKENISNPDIIHPGLRLRVPPKAPLTEEEISARNDYYSNRELAQSETE